MGKPLTSDTDGSDLNSDGDLPSCDPTGFASTSQGLIKGVPPVRRIRSERDPAAVRLITSDEAIVRIRRLLASEHDDDKQLLLAIAGTALAAVIALGGHTIEVEEIEGLQASVNRALFVFTEGDIS